MLDVSLGQSIIHDGKEYPVQSLPQNLMDIIEAGGLVEAMKKRNGVK